MRNDRGSRSGRKTSIFISRVEEGAGMKFPADFSWEPPSDVIVTVEEVIVIIDIAGMNSDSINIVTDGNKLRISGIRGS